MFAGLFGIFRVSAVETQRRERDSNPRRLSPQQFSRLPQSTTLPSLRGENTAVTRVDTNFFLESIGQWCSFLIFKRRVKMSRPVMSLRTSAAFNYILSLFSKIDIIKRKDSLLSFRKPICYAVMTSVGAIGHEIGDSLASISFLKKG